MVGFNSVNRRQFLSGTVGAAGSAALLAARGPGGGPGGPAPPPPGGSRSPPPAAPKASRPAASKEPGNMSILEWGGYEAAGTKAQTAGMTVAGKTYIDKYGPNSVTYTYITYDDQALAKATTGGPFDLMHPCHENIPDYVS